MRPFIITVAMFMTFSEAFAQSAAEKSGVNSLVGNAPKTEDFVAKAAMSDMFEIESSKLAMERADEQTKAFAKQMVTDHTKTSQELKQLVEGGGVRVTLPTTMNSAQ
jgi:putative membrane protein